MASRSYHKRRTRERKARQAASRETSQRRAHQEGLRGFHRHAAAMAVPLFIEPNAPKMFVRDGKPVPFEYL